MKGKRDLSDYSDAVDELAQWVCEASNEDTDDEVVRYACQESLINSPMKVKKALSGTQKQTC